MRSLKLWFVLVADPHFSTNSFWKMINGQPLPRWAFGDSLDRHVVDRFTFTFSRPLQLVYGWKWFFAAIKDWGTLISAKDEFRCHWFLFFHDSLDREAAWRRYWEESNRF